MKFEVYFFIFLVNFTYIVYGGPVTQAGNEETTTIDPNCANNTVDPSLLDNSDLGIGGVVVEPVRVTTQGTHSTTGGSGEVSPTVPETETSSRLSPTPVPVTTRSGQETNAPNSTNPPTQETSEPESTTDGPGGASSTAPETNSSVRLSPTPVPVTISSGQETTAPNSTNPPTQETPEPENTTNGPGGESSSPLSNPTTTQPPIYSTNDGSDVTIPTTASPCSRIICSLPAGLQQLAAQLLAYLQEIFNNILAALGITNFG